VRTADARAKAGRQLNYWSERNPCSRNGSNPCQAWTFAIWAGTEECLSAASERASG